MTTSRWIAQRRCCVCGKAWLRDRIIEVDAQGMAIWPPTCGNPECDSVALGVDLLTILARRRDGPSPAPQGE